jgi:hypothetical protein
MLLLTVHAKLLFMKNKSILLVSTLVVSAIFASCEREESNDGGGKGGNAVLRITPMHHAQNIDSCRVYIKYNASNVPQQYDDSTDCVMIDSTPVATFTQLREGDYYLYGEGWDPLIQERVLGGIPYSIAVEDTISITLPVTESSH